MSEHPQPDSSYQRPGLHTVTPFLVVSRPGALIDFLKHAFEATELFSTGGADDALYAEVKIGDSTIMISGPGMGSPGQTTMYVYVPDVDAVYSRGVQAGATSRSEPEDQAYGDRTAGFADAFGTVWNIATHKP